MLKLLSIQSDQETKQGQIVHKTVLLGKQKKFDLLTWSWWSRDHGASLTQVLGPAVASEG